MFGDMGKMMKQAKEIKSRMSEVEKELLKSVLEGKSRDGLVICRLDGKLNFKEIQIADELVEKKDRRAMENAVSEAVKGAIDAAQREANQKLSAITGGLSIPGLF